MLTFIILVYFNGRSLLILERLKKFLCSFNLLSASLNFSLSSGAGKKTCKEY